MNISLSPFAPENWSRETGWTVPSRVSLLIIHTQAEPPGAYSQDFSRFPRRRPLFIPPTAHRVSPELIRSRNCVPMAFIAEGPPAPGPVVLKVVPVTGAAFAGDHGPINVRLSFPHPLYYYWYVVDRCDTESIRSSVSSYVIHKG